MIFSSTVIALLLPEIPLEQASKRLAVTGLVAGHLMHGVVDGVQVQGLGALGQVGLQEVNKWIERLYSLVF